MFMGAIFPHCDYANFFVCQSEKIKSKALLARILNNSIHKSRPIHASHFPLRISICFTWQGLKRFISLQNTSDNSKPINPRDRLKKKMQVLLNKQCMYIKIAP